MKKIFLYILAILLIPVYAFGAYGGEVWVAQTAAGAGNGSTSSDPLALSAFNSNAGPGDKAILKVDTYTTAINPTNNGSDLSSNAITYQSQYEYNGSGTQYGCNFTVNEGIDLNGSQYIIIDGIRSSGSKNHTGSILNSSYIIVLNSRFDYKDSAWPGFPIEYSLYIKFDTCLFQPEPGITSISDIGQGRFLTIGDETQNATTKYVYMDSCTFIDGADHDVISFAGADYCALKDSTIYNTGLWGTEGATCISTNPDNLPGEFITFSKWANYNLIDNVTLYESGANKSDTCLVAIHIHNSKYNIIRNSVGYDIDGAFTNAYTNTTNTNDTQYNMIYNNTVYNAMSSGYWSSDYQGAIRFYHNSGADPVRYNKVGNNILSTIGKRAFSVVEGASGGAYNNEFFGNWIHSITQADEVRRYSTEDGTNTMTLREAETDHSSEFYSNLSPIYASGGPLDATDPKLTDPANGNMILQSDSSCIDAGQWLTTINQATGSAQTITLTDYPYFFFAGIPQLSIAGDTIKTENGQTGVISSINYGAKQITLTSAINVVNGEGVFLTYNGNGPDIGAEEYGGTPPVPCENFNPADEATGVSTTIDLTFDGQSGETFDVYFDDVDGTTLQCDDYSESGGTVTCDVGTLANSDTFYWKVHANTANQDFPSTGRFEFTTVGTPPDLGGSIYRSYGGASVYNPSGGSWKYITP